MPGSLTDWRKRSNEELKSKGRIEREMQWGNKVEGSSVLQNISLQKGCINLFYLQVGMDKLSLQELNKGIYSQAREQVCLVIAGTKVHLVKAMVFPVVMYGCESWTIKKLSTKELMLLNSGVGEDS